MYFKDDIKFRIEDNRLILTYEYKDDRGEIRSFGKAIEVHKDLCITCLQEFIETCICEIAVYRALHPSYGRGIILSGGSKTNV